MSALLQARGVGKRFGAVVAAAELDIAIAPGEQVSLIGSNGARTTANPDPLVLPAFTRVDAALFYRLNRYVNFAMNVDNLFDELIFVNASVGSNIEVAAPRTATFRTTRPTASTSCTVRVSPAGYITGRM